MLSKENQLVGKCEMLSKKKVSWNKHFCMRIVFTKFLKVDDIKQEQKFTLLVSFELGKEIEKNVFFCLVLCL